MDAAKVEGAWLPAWHLGFGGGIPDTTDFLFVSLDPTDVVAPAEI